MLPCPPSSLALQLFLPASYRNITLSQVSSTVQLHFQLLIILVFHCRIPDLIYNYHLNGHSLDSRFAPSRHVPVVSLLQRMASFNVPERDWSDISLPQPLAITWLAENGLEH